MKAIGPRFRERVFGGGTSTMTFGVNTRRRGASHPDSYWYPELIGQPYGEPLVYSNTNAPNYQKWERCWDSTNPGPPYRSGGDFTKTTISYPNNELQGVGHYVGDPSLDVYSDYTGGFGIPQFELDPLAVGSQADFGDDRSNPMYFPDLSSLGNGAYARLRPSLERAGLGVALAEARDLPRMLSTTAKSFSDIWGAMGGSASSRIMQPKNVADNFLNVQFGWVPFIKDISQLWDVTQNAESYLAQQVKDNNQWVRRHRTEKVIENDELLATYYTRKVEPLLPADLYQPGVSMESREIHRTYTRVWYEGAFKYYRPELDETHPDSKSKWGNMMKMMNLYGLRLSPAIIWKATPWTWLIDWVSNVGDVIQRASDWGLDGVVSKYMYLMHHIRHDQILQVDMPLRGGVQKMSFNRFAEVKSRRGASSSFGFDLTPSQLSGRQIGILGALGISRR